MHTLASHSRHAFRLWEDEMARLEEKLEVLERVFHEMQSVAVAYSGGVDSSLVLKVAFETLADDAIALTAVSGSLPAHERDEAKRIARLVGAHWEAIETLETEQPGYIANGPNRCYFCKSTVYEELANWARRAGYRFLVDGTNADDAGDHRPGRIAASENDVRSPLEEAGFTKADVREAARQLGLPNWDKPAAACLSSRIPYGSSVTPEKLARVERAEQELRRLGFGQLRVRHHGEIARIEVDPEELERALRAREAIVSRLIDIGYTYVTLDLAGFRSGSMNETLGSIRGRGKAQAPAD